MKILLASLWLLLDLSFVLTTSEKTVLTLSDIIPKETDDYDKMRPPKEEGKPTIVDFHVTVMDIDSFNENSKTYSVNLFLSQSWKDHRLHSPPNITADYSLVDVDLLKHLWMPDSFVKNAKQETYSSLPIPNQFVWLYKSKSFLYMVKKTLTMTCAMNFAMYPHDIQECNIQIESFSYTTEDVIFRWDPHIPLVIDKVIELPQFEISRNFTSDCTREYTTGNFTCLEIVFTLRRRIGHFLFHTYIPTCLVVIMSWVSFWIKLEMLPSRVIFGVTSLLTLSIQHAHSQATAPAVSYITAIDVFMCSCTIFVFMALIEYAFVYIKVRDCSEEASKPSDETKLSEISLISFKDKASILAEEVTKPATTNHPAPWQVRRANAVTVDRLSRYLFPLSFTFFNMVYWIVISFYH